MHLVPEGADFLGLLTPITLVVIGLHGTEGYSRRPAVAVTAITKKESFYVRFTTPALPSQAGWASPRSPNPQDPIW